VKEIKEVKEVKEEELNAETRSARRMRMPEKKSSPQRAQSPDSRGKREEGEMVEENVALVRRWFEEVWNQKRSETIRELLAPNCIAHGTSETGGDLHGPEGFLELHARLLDAFPDMHIEVEDGFGAGDQVAVRWTATMHHRGNRLGIEATGAAVKIAGLSMARIVGGKVVETWDSWDKLGMFQQIEEGKARAAEA
jgi:predicted ester cyclase